MVSEEKIFKVFYVDILGRLAPLLDAMFFFKIIINFRNLKEGNLRLLLQNINRIWPVVSEEKIVETVDARRRRRTTDIQGITRAHPEHSSGEHKRVASIVYVLDRQ